MVAYVDSIDGVTADRLQGFFVGWPKPPFPETHLRILDGSDHIVLAIDDKSDRIVGFITAISDGVLSAYMPLLEVLPDYQGQGIGKELMRRMLEKLRGLYMIDLLTDRELEPFYSRLGMKPGFAMMIRDFEKQSGM